MSNVEMKPVIEQSFLQYAGAVLQSRALVDVRDGLKPSARQIFYSMLTRKLTSDNPYKKTANAVGMAMADYYIHGDASCLGVIMRASQPFSLRYPLVDVKGNAGTLMESGNWAASRYTESRLSEMSALLFADINKDTISDWRDNYDNTKTYPAVLPSKGFYNIVNGTSGIGIGMASSCPQYNLREMNNALIKLLWNPEISYEEIYCAPDFATGGFLLNEEEVKESMKTGYGAACELRAKIEYDQKERCLTVVEMPYGVYTNTICNELENILNDEENSLIERFNDLTGSKPLIKIYLKKTANVNKAIKFLYKNTSLQSHYSINFTMLENGRFPKVFGWKEMLSSFLNHQKEVYRRGFEFDLNKFKKRLLIVEGILIALHNIEEVIEIIKKSESTKEASIALQKRFGLVEEQTKAILEIKLSRLAHMEVKKFEEEKAQLIAKITKIEEILANETLFKKEIEKDLVAVRDKYGDARRTVVLNLEKEEDEPVEIKTINVNLTNKNNIFAEETSNLYIQKRGGKGVKFKLDSNERIIDSATITTVETVLMFSKTGMCYNVPAAEIPLEKKTSLETILTLPLGEEIKAITSFNKRSASIHTIIFTKNGYMKKSLLTEYETKRKSLKAINLDSGDEVVSVLFLNEERVGILSQDGHLLICETKDIRPIGRAAKGVKSIKLEENDCVVAAKVIPETTQTIATISKNGYGKKVLLSDISVTGRYTKGTTIQTLGENDTLVDFEILEDTDRSVLVISEKTQIKISIEQIPTHSKKAQGVKLIKTTDFSVIGLKKI